MIKEKKCKGHGVAKGFGCGKMIDVKFRVYGLGKMCCYPDWLLNSDNGKIKMQKAILKVQKPRIETNKALELRKEENALKQALNNTKLVVHAYVKLRDTGKTCISCDAPYQNHFQAGHFYPAGSYETLRFNLDNIHGQCPQCNLYLNGNFDNYSLRLPKRIGKERYEKLLELASIDKQFSKVWNIENLKEIRANVKILSSNFL